MARVAQSAALWILLAPYSRGLIVPLSTLPAPWNPFDAFTDRQDTARAIVAVRVVGGATVLPVMEEVRKAHKELSGYGVEDAAAIIDELEAKLG